MKFKLVTLFAILGLLVFVGCDSVVEEVELTLNEEPAMEETVEEEVEEEIEVEEDETALEPEPIQEPAPVVVPEPAVIEPIPEPEPIHEASAAPMPEPEPEPLESKEVTLAKCLTENGAKLFTASWCGHCNNQKAAFGDGLAYLDNTECAVDGGWAAACTEAGVKAVPAWQFADGTTKMGNTPLATLASLGGCTY